MFKRSISRTAQMLQEWENTSDSFQEINTCSTTVAADTSQIVKCLSERVDHVQEFFLFHDAVHPFQGQSHYGKGSPKKLHPQVY